MKKFNFEFIAWLALLVILVGMVSFNSRPTPIENLATFISDKENHSKLEESTYVQDEVKITVSGRLKTVTIYAGVMKMPNVVLVRKITVTSSNDSVDLFREDLTRVGGYSTLNHAIETLYVQLKNPNYLDNLNKADKILR